MDYLNDMALFTEVVRCKSFRGAATTLGIPNSTLSRRISALEAGIGLRLLHRTTRKVELTDAGQIYYERCKRLVDEARLAHEDLAERVAHPVGTLRVSLPADFAITYLAPYLPEFAALYPGIDFDMDLTPRNVDLVSEPFDLAIRASMPEPGALIARVIARVTSVLCASPEYLAREGQPSVPVELKQHQCLALRKGIRWTLQSSGQKIEMEPCSRFRANSVSMMRQMAVQGMGIVLLPERILKTDLEGQRLLRILPAWKGLEGAIYAVTETRLLPAKTQRFIEFLQAKLMSGQGDDV